LRSVCLPGVRRRLAAQAAAGFFRKGTVDSVNARRRVVALFTAVATVLLAYVAIGTRRANPDVSEAGIRLNACVTADGGYRAECVQLMWDDAVSDGYLPTFVAAMERFVADHPVFEIPCHDQAHTAGIRAYERGSDPRTLVLEGASSLSVCDNGFLHGVLGALGRSSEGTEALPALLATCEQLPAPTDFDCAHAFGHAVWSATRDVMDAAAVCSNYAKQEKKNSCMLGVMMTILSPRHDPAEVPLFDSIDEAFVAYPGMCAESAALFGDEWPIQCFSMLGEAAVAEKVRENGTPLDDPALSAAALETVLGGAISPCTALPTAQVEPCRMAVYRAAVRQILGGSGTTVDALTAVCGTETALANDPDVCTRVLEKLPLPSDEVSSP